MSSELFESIDVHKHLYFILTVCDSLVKYAVPGPTLFSSNILLYCFIVLVVFIVSDEKFDVQQILLQV